MKRTRLINAKRLDGPSLLIIVLMMILTSSAVSHAAQYGDVLDFQSDDQSMWSTGDAWQLNWRQDVELYNWDYSFETSKAGIKGPLFIGSTNLYTAYGHTDGRFGFSPYINVDSGSVDLDYSVAFQIEYPDAYSVSPGETFTLNTSYDTLGTGSFTTNFPEIKAGVDLLFDAHASAGVNEYGLYGCGILLAGACWHELPTTTELIGLDIGPDTGVSANALGLVIGPFDADLIYDDEGRIPGLQFNNDEISLFGETLLEPEVDFAGYGSVELNVPDIDTVGLESEGFVSTGEDDLFRLEIDADKIALDIVDKAIGAAIAAGTAGAGSGALSIDLPDLEGSSDLEPVLGSFLAGLIPIEVSYNILDIEPFFDVDLAQEFTFTPDDLMVRFDLGNGTQTEAIRVGESLELVMPDEGFDVTPTFFLPDSNLSNMTELAFDFGVELTLLDFGLNFQGILGLIPDIDPPPLFNEDLTVAEILDFAGLSTEFLRPDVFNQTFDFAIPELAMAAFKIEPDIGNDGTGGDNSGPASVPEPGTLTLFACGIIVLIIQRRKSTSDSACHFA